MRILHLVGRSHRRGAELVALELADALVPSGHESRLLAVGPGHEGGREPGIPVLVDSARQHPLVLLRAARRLRGDLAAHPADVILAHGGSALQAAALATLGRPVPIVYQLIMGMPLADRGRGWHRWWRWLLGRCAAVVSLTEALSDEVRALGYTGPIERIANARLTDRFAAVDRLDAGTTLRADLGLDPAASVIGFVGHLVDQKRPDVAVDVLARSRDAGHDVHLVVVGGGPNDAALREQVDRLGVEKFVTLAGHRPDVEAVLGGIDLLLLTSDGEGMPGVAIEAQMSGCPVLAFPVGGVHEVVDSGVTGVVLDDHDPAAMAAAVAELLDDGERLRAMGAAARIRSERFSMARAAEAYHRVLGAAQGS